MDNICILGDSIAKGVVYDTEKKKYTLCKEGFVHQLEERIHKPIPCFAKFGCTSSKGIKVLRRQESKIKDCRYTLVEFGGNDCDLMWNEIAESPMEEHTAQVSLPDFRKNLIELVGRIRAAGSTPVLMTLPPLDPCRFYGWISKDLDWEGILHFLKEDITNIYRWQEEYSLLIEDVAKCCKTHLLDIRKAFLDTGDYRQFLCSDGMHPNRRGHTLIANYIEPVLQFM